jgi:hypothetical protein
MADTTTKIDPEAEAKAAAEFATKLKALKLMIVEMFGVPIMSGGWVSYPATQRDAFASAFLSLCGKDSAVSKLATKYNQQVWDGWDNGTLPEPVKDDKGKVLTPGIEGTRDRRNPNGEKPGRKAKVLTVEQQLFGED